MAHRRASADESKSQNVQPLQVNNRNSAASNENRGTISSSDEAKKRLAKVKDVLKNSKTLK